MATNRHRRPAKKVIVAAEDDTLRHALTSELSKDFEVLEVEDGFELCDYLWVGQSLEDRFTWPAAIISDVELLGYGGLEVCRWVRDLELAVPFILLSSNTDRETRVAASRAGASFLLSKPVKLEEVRAAVAELAGSHA